MRLGEFTAQAIFREFLSRFVDDVDTPHLKDTPDRVVRMFDELLSGYGDPNFKFTTFPAGKKPSLVTVTDLEFYSLCAHHLSTFHGIVHVSYLPDKKLCGLSKIARVIKHYSARLQVQEELTEQIADYLEERLKPHAVAVMMIAEHMCMAARGIKSPGHRTTTSAMRGKFVDDWGLKEEFFTIIGITKK